MDYTLATDGVSFNVIRDHFPEIYERLCTRGKVFARMTPDQKEFLIEELQELGYYVRTHHTFSWILFREKKNGILLPKLFWPTVRKNCSSDQENHFKFEAEGRELAKFLRSLGQFIQTVKGQNNFW